MAIGKEPPLRETLAKATRLGDKRHQEARMDALADAMANETGAHVVQTALRQSHGLIATFARSLSEVSTLHGALNLCYEFRTDPTDNEIAVSLVNAQVSGIQQSLEKALYP